MTQEAKSAASSRKKTPPPAAKPGSHSSTATGPVFTQYQAAVQLVQQGKYERAIAAFEKVLPAAPPEIMERCKMYISTCRRQLDKAGPRLSYARRTLRLRRVADQCRRFRGGRQPAQGHPLRRSRADFAFYGLALLYSITGKTQDCLESLAQAIELNPKNRLQARSDNDFQSMVDDPRFTELLYPELP